MKIAMSSGHGKYISGAVGIITEHAEAVRVVNRTAEFLQGMSGVSVATYEDTVSKTQNENLNRIVAWHNAQIRDLDVSVHFNDADAPASKALGTECYYYSQAELADKVVEAIHDASGLINRGGKKNTGLFFLSHTEEPSILVEVCFVGSQPDVTAYNQHFDAICSGIAGALAGQAIAPQPPQPEPMPPEPVPVPPVETPTVEIKTIGAVRVIVNGVEITPAPPVPLPPPIEPLFQAMGKCSWFGGPQDTGVSPSEGLAFIYKYDQAPHLFLPQQPPGTTGLARRLNPDVPYVACRWDYSKTSKTMLADKTKRALVRAGDKEFFAWPADWGPHQDTGRVADLSPGLMKSLGIKTDDYVEIVYPADEVIA